MQIVNQSQIKKKEDPKKKIPSFEFSTVLKDVKSRLNSSKSDESLRSTSSTQSSCTGNNTALMTGASGGLPIPAMNLSSMRGSIFSRGRLEEASNSIFSPNFRQNTNHSDDNNIALIRNVKLSTDVESSNKSTLTSNSGDESTTTMTTQKRPRELELAKPDAKRVS